MVFQCVANEAHNYSPATESPFGYWLLLPSKKLISSNAGSVVMVAARPMATTTTAPHFTAVIIARKIQISIESGLRMGVALHVRPYGQIDTLVGDIRDQCLHLF